MVAAVAMLKTRQKEYPSTLSLSRKTNVPKQRKEERDGLILWRNSALDLEPSP